MLLFLQIRNINYEGNLDKENETQNIHIVLLPVDIKVLNRPYLSYC